MKRTKRDKKGEEKVRFLQITAQVSPEEKERVEREAKALGVSVSEYVRTKVLTGKSPRLRTERLARICPAIGEIERELRRIGLNINQIAKQANRRRVVDYQVLESLQRVEAELTSLLSLVVQLVREYSGADTSSEQ